MERPLLDVVMVEVGIDRRVKSMSDLKVVDGEVGGTVQGIR
jgi:hypothetical protein